MTYRRRIVAAFATTVLAGSAFAGLAAPANAAADATSDRRHLEADLRGRNEVPPADRDGKGEAEVVLRPNQGVVCFDIDVMRIAEVIGAHIHEGVAGENGPIVVDFMVTENGLDGCVTADSDLLRDIRRHPSNYYVNVHTTQFPSGAIRGQLERDPR
jgi:hypothetical protein